MDKQLDKLVAKAAKADRVAQREVVQELWSGYGQIVRYETSNPELPMVIVKHIRFPKQHRHPAGWSTERAHKRKLKSYRVETAWYQTWADKCAQVCRVPRCLATEAGKREMVIVLEDLDGAGFSRRRRTVTSAEVQLGLDWLANFHAIFLHESPDGLWKNGTYWHLDARPDELAALSDQTLKAAAGKIDLALKGCHYKTFVHGDPKLANFCFADDGSHIAAVDFQYVGGGCGMKDLAYYVGSCFHEHECAAHEDEVLQVYFNALRKALVRKAVPVDVDSLELEWRRLYPYAWADFHRFLQGWSPGRWRNTPYSEQMTEIVLEELGMA